MIQKVYRIEDVDLNKMQEEKESGRKINEK